MDVVKTNIERYRRLGVDLKSTPGQGSTFTIKIRLTLAIGSALIIESGGERFAIPQISVVELVRPKRGGAGDTAADGRADGAAETSADRKREAARQDGVAETVIERINDTPVLRLRDRLLPLINLNDLLRLGEKSREDEAAHVVVAQVGASTCWASSSIARVRH